MHQARYYPGVMHQVCYYPGVMHQACYYHDVLYQSFYYSNKVAFVQLVPVSKELVREKGQETLWKILCNDIIK